MFGWETERLRNTIAAALIIATLGAVAILAIRETGRSTVALEIEVPTPTTAPDEIVVHIIGEVRNPGVYRVSPGTRLFEAVELAGGRLEGADTNAVNLALALVDGHRYEIPSLDAATLGETGGPTLGQSGAQAGPINVNLATLDELEALPGIGPVLANAIVSHRRETGPFERIEDLLDVPGVGSATLERLRPLVAAP